MHQAGESGGRGSPAGKPRDLDEDEFVVELTIVDSRRLQGFVLHRQSGQRTPVASWAELTDVITRFLAADRDPAETEESEVSASH
jgi:hypothetical protein